ncbi:MAG: riboflavin biosynthesis protein RibF [Roseburia sp.]|nr:riboflavin biosynthesis protein RibF [Roseburia sp.]MCM1098419.1 riboflavin biosynthesis protein RibF [Ruminococcus flavefaciens]
MEVSLEIITGTTDFYLTRETAAAIGKFDGVHIGHRRLLEEILCCKSRGLASCVFTFDPPPAVFFGRSDGKELTTREEKRLLFERLGVDLLIEFPMTAETAAMLPEVFAEEILAKRMNTRLLAAGTDLSFGAGGAGNAALLERLGPELGFTVKTIDKVCLDGREVSSTYLRSRVEEGDMRLAERLMGTAYPIAGRVVTGKRLGRTLGFPTVNLLPGREKLLPPAGVYFSDVQYGGRIYKAVSNVGCKPTVTEEGVTGVESYLYDFQGEIYGEEILVFLREFWRPERRFESLEALKRQLEQDVAEGALRPNL